MKNKLFTITEDDSSEPYALIIKLNDEILFSKLEKQHIPYFHETFKKSLTEFAYEQCYEFNGKEGLVNIDSDVYLWLSTDELDVYKFLLKQIQAINNIEILDSSIATFNINNDLKENIKIKFNYYLLENELSNNHSEQKKKIKI